MLRDGRSVGKNLEEMHQYVSAQMIQSSWIVTKDNLLYILWIKKTREDTKPFYRVKLAEKIWKSSAILFSYMLLEVVFVSVFFFRKKYYVSISIMNRVHYKALLFCRSAIVCRLESYNWNWRNNYSLWIQRRITFCVFHKMD